MTDTDGPPSARRRLIKAGADGTAAGKSEQTLRLYALDWRHFTAWCRVHRHPTLPTDAAALTAYLIELAASSSRGTSGRRLAAIRAMHREAGFAAPALDPAARAAVRAVKRPPRATRATLPDAATLVRLASGCAGDLAGLRDRAMLLLAAAAPLPQETLLRLQREQLRFTEAGLSIDLVTPLHLSGDPVRALAEWLDASSTSFGPVFRKVDRWGNVEHDALGADGLRRVVARRLRRTRVR